MPTAFTGGSLSFKGDKKKKKKAKKKEAQAKHKLKDDEVVVAPSAAVEEDMTPAERRAMERKKERVRIDNEKLAKKSHRERIEEFNEKLGCKSNALVAQKNVSRIFSEIIANTFAFVFAILTLCLYSSNRAK